MARQSESLVNACCRTQVEYVDFLARYLVESCSTVLPKSDMLFVTFFVETKPPTRPAGKR